MLGIFTGIIKRENGDTATARLAGYFSNLTPRQDRVLTSLKQPLKPAWRKALAGFFNAQAGLTILVLFEAVINDRSSARAAMMDGGR